MQRSFSRRALSERRIALIVNDSAPSFASLYLSTLINTSADSLY